jgi:hypothetical protein
VPDNNSGVSQANTSNEPYQKRKNKKLQYKLNVASRENVFLTATLVHLAEVLAVTIIKMGKSLINSMRKQRLTVFMVFVSPHIYIIKKYATVCSRVFQSLNTHP